MTGTQILTIALSTPPTMLLVLVGILIRIIFAWAIPIQALGNYART
jgi:hypothetical protein